MNPPLIIMGSARKDGNTLAFIEKAFNNKPYELIDLLDYQIYPYNYDEKYPEGDQFLEVMERVISCSVIIWATPVYWYSMSGILKDIFDRLTDLTHGHTHIRQKLKGINTYLLSVGASSTLPEGFEVPFRDTAQYFGMQYNGAFYATKKQLLTGHDFSHVYDRVRPS